MADRLVYPLTERIRNEGEAGLMPQVQESPPKYQQIADHYQAAIARGDFIEGGRFLTQREIAEKWPVSSGTVARALQELRYRGQIVTARGSGSTVCAGQRVAAGGHTRAVSLVTTGRIYAPGEWSKIMSSDLVDAPPEIADGLGVEPGTPVLRRQRVTYLRGMATQMSTSWMPHVVTQVAPELLETKPIPGGTVLLLVQRGGEMWRLTDGDESVGARPASDDEVETLGLLGGWVLEGRNRWRTADGQVVELGEYVCPPDQSVRFTYQFRN